MSHFLNVSGSEQFTNSDCQKHLESTTLEALDVSFCPLITDEAFVHINAPLAFLNLQGCTGITDKTLYELTRLKTLKHLFLAFNDQLTEEGLLALKTLPLKTLKIYHKKN